MKSNKIFIASLVIITVIGGLWYLNEQRFANTVPCTTDALICPDGTPVGREGRDCHFAACPTKAEKNITVSEPTAQQVIGLPLIIKGQARVFESALSYRLKDADGTVLVEGFTMANAPDVGQFGPYAISVSYPAPKGTSGTVEVYSHSPKDGEEINKVSVPVVFGPVEAMTVKIYLGNRLKAINTTDCSKVFPVERRIAKTTGVAKAALEELLTGVTVTEVNKGYFTNINPGAKLQSVSLANGVAKADFDQMLQQGVAGSCRVEAIRSQINETLKQFSSVKSLIISINGDSETILQP